MLDGIILLAVFVFGCWVVPKLLWKSYGHHFIGLIEGVAGGVRSLKAFTPLGQYRPADDDDYDNQDDERGTEPPNERTNERRSSTERTAVEERALALQLDRKRIAVIHTLVAAGWNVSEIRGVLKGTAEDLGKEIAAVKELQAAGRTSLPADDPKAWTPGERPGQIVRAR